MKPYALALLLLLPSTVFGGNPDNRQVLAGLDAIKIVCDVNVGNPELLLRRLELIDETFRQIREAGVTPAIVVAFRGGASRYVTRGEGHVKDWDLPVKKKIQNIIGLFHNNGLRMEQCAIAADAHNIDPADFPQSITVVPNGYISLAAYQARGYAFLPMD